MLAKTLQRLDAIGGVERIDDAALKRVHLAPSEWEAIKAFLATAKTPADEATPYDDTNHRAASPTQAGIQQPETPRGIVL